VNNWQRNQPPRLQPRPQNTRTAQSYFQSQQQRQMPNQYGQAGNAGERYGRSTPTGQFQQAMMNPSPSGLANRQPPSRQHQPQQQQQQSQQNQQPTSSQSMSPYQSYTGSNYMDMDYSSASFGGQTQLEAALTEPNVPEGLYNAMGRR
jgi:hypothetical protein